MPRTKPPARGSPNAACTSPPKPTWFAAAHVSQLEAATAEGSVFVVRDGGRTIVATTRPEPTVGLVFYDLKTALRSIDPVGAEDDGEA